MTGRRNTWHATVSVLTGMCAVLMSGCASQLTSDIKSGNVEAVEQAIADGANIQGNYWTSWKYPLQSAIESNNLGMVKLLHESGATLHKEYLAFAAEFGSKNTYSYLVDQGLSLEQCFIRTYSKPWFRSNFDLSGTMPPIGLAIARGDYPSVVTLTE